MGLKTYKILARVKDLLKCECGGIIDYAMYECDVFRNGKSIYCWTCESCERVGCDEFKFVKRKIRIDHL